MFPHPQLVLAILVASGQEPPARTYSSTFCEAQAELRKGSWSEARASFEECLRITPRTAICACALACCAARAGDPVGALQWLERAAEWGWNDAAVAAWDEDLASLRARPAFVELIRRMTDSEQAEGSLESGRSSPVSSLPDSGVS